MARRQVLHLGLAALCAAAFPAQPAGAQGLEQALVQIARLDGGVVLSFDIRLTLPKAVEAALQHGVPIYFVAQASLFRQRWYWRDERVARVVRTWRLTYQPLTASWRVSLGGLHQSHATLADALAALSRANMWRLADAGMIDSAARHYVEFSYRLDTSQLPGPMQIGLAGQSEWQLGIERVLRLEPAP